jgi:hypothetical protein
MLSALAALAPLAGLVAMSLISLSVADSPFAFLSIQGSWGRSYSAGGLLRSLVSLFGYGGPPIDILGFAIGVGCLPVIWKHLPHSLSLYAIGLVLMPLLTGSILSFGRFMSVSIPHFLALAIVLDRRPSLRGIVWITFLTLQILVAKGLVGWYFVG